MTKEYEAYLAYRKARKPEPKKRNPVYEDYLMHYGVQGQKWGVRQWQNTDGSYTEAGKHHYGWGYGRQPGTGYNGGINPGPSRIPRNARVDGYHPQRRPMGAQSAVRPATNTQRTRKPTQAEIEARKARTRKIIAIAAGVAVAAALGYAAYRGSTKLRDNMRAEVFKRFDTNPNNVHTLNSKYWTNSDRKLYSQMTADRAKTVSQNLTRRDAVAAKIQEKTGLRINMPQSRSKFLAQRRSEQQYSNFIRDAESRAQLNRDIHNARADLRSAQKKLSTYQNTAHIGTSKEYEPLWNRMHQRSVDQARERLNNLLLKRRAG